MKYKDYYQILGVQRDADEATIKRAYRRLARKFHPDVSKEPNAEERFKEVAEAYEVLRDAEKRAAYDSLGRQWRAGDDFTPPPGWRHGERSLNEDFAFRDLFESLFGVGGARSGVRREDIFGGDAQHVIEVDLEEAFKGTERSLRIEPATVAFGGQPHEQGRTVRVRVPARITHGQRIRLSGQGHAGPGGRRGDLFLEVHLRPHRQFEVQGRDIHLRLPVTPWEAALGASVQVPTLGGKVDLRVPPGTQSGQRLRLKGRGLGTSPAGDQYVRIEIMMPPVKSDADRELLKKMAQQMPFDPRAERFR